MLSFDLNHHGKPPGIGFFNGTEWADQESEKLGVRIGSFPKVVSPKNRFHFNHTPFGLKPINFFIGDRAKGRGFLFIPIYCTVKINQEFDIYQESYKKPKPCGILRVVDQIG